jgi:membrane protease YdiL (CAAX protease family)
VLESVHMATDPAAERHTGRLIAWLVVVGLLTALAYIGQLTSEDTPDDVAYQYDTSIQAAVFYGVVLGVLLLISWGTNRRELFALRRPESWPRALGLAALALVVIWIAGAALSPFLDATDEQGLVPDDWDSSRAGAFALFFVVVTVGAPIVEELTYRGLGFALLAPFGAWVAIVTTGILFGLAHGLFVALPVLTIFGIAIGWLRARTRSIYPPMLLHATFNGAALILSVTVA